MFRTNMVLTTVLYSLEPVSVPLEVPSIVPYEGTRLKVMMIYIVLMSYVYEEETPVESTETEDEETPQHKK